VPAQNGLTVLSGDLRSRLRSAIDSPRHRTLAAPVKQVKPEVTTDELAQRYPVYLTIDRAGFALRLWKNLELAKTYTIAVGQAGLETPAGEYTIDDKQVNPSWYVPDSAWAGDLAGQVIPPGPQDPLKGGGWASTAARASTAPTTWPRSAPRPRTAACGCRSPKS